jgi:hypothetical protein
MDHKIWYDNENEIIHFKIAGDYLQEDVWQVNEQIINLLEGKPYRQILISMDPSSKIENRETRNSANQAMQKAGITEMAYVGASAAVRMITKVLLKTGGIKTNGEFFKDTKDAIEWLKSKR